MTRTPPRVTLDTPIGADGDLERDDVRWANGERITQADVDELVEDLHARSAGRPSLTAPGKHSPSVTIRLPEPLNDKLNAESERTGRRRSEIVRDALEALLAS